MRKFAISPLRSENYPEWYQKVVQEADLAENSDVRGCMVIKSWGYALWEAMQHVMDQMFKATGHQNAYFPLFIPLKYIEKETEHVEGFARECAVVTHTRLQTNAEGKLVPASPLEEPLIVRPTSETIIGESFSRWVHSYRDLPILINQWANVVRWEMRTRMFLRTSEFLWQEGHTAHETAHEAREEAERMLCVYRDFAENYMAMPVLCGEKTALERFPGAVTTLCIEAMMQDGKSLQAGTSHFLGQNFAKSSNISFTGRDGQMQYAWTSSWGSSTRLIGGLIMTHSDDDGLILPPRLAAYHVVILPVIHHEEDQTKVMEYCQNLRKNLTAINYNGSPVRVFIDQRDISGGEKKWSWVKKGVPLIVEVGMRDIESKSLMVTCRYTMEKKIILENLFLSNLSNKLQEIQDGMFNRALKFREENTHFINDREEFESFWKQKNIGYVVTFCGENSEIEEQMKKDYNITIRCVLPNDEKITQKCLFSGQSETRKVVWAKSY